MFASLLVFLGLLVFSILCNQKGKEKAALYTLGFTLLLVYMALDIYKIHDVAVYEEFFNGFKSYSLSQIKQVSSYIEPGYIAFNIIIAKIYPNFKFFYFIYAIVVITSYLFFIRRYSNHTWLSGILLLCMFFFPLFLVRQYIALSICLFSIPLIFKRKLIPFALCIFLAYLFHRSALIFSLCYFLPLVAVNKKNIVLVAIVGGAVVASMGFLDNIIVNAVMGGSLASHYGEYLQEGSSNSWKSAIVAIADFLFVLLCYRGNFNKLNKEQSFFFLMCGVYTLLSIVGVVGSVFQAVYRILPYFSVSIIVLLPDAVGYIKDKSVRAVSLTAIIGFYVFLLVSMSKDWVYFTF